MSKYKKKITELRTLKVNSQRKLNGFKPEKRKHKNANLKAKLKKLRASAPTPQLDMSEWEGLSLPSQLTAALSELGFSSPTPIQRLCIPAARAGHVVGAAETGSGKTLAFGLPILSRLLAEEPPETAKEGESGGLRVREEGGGDNGCVGWVDDIPEAVFQKMLSSPDKKSPLSTPLPPSLPPRPLQALVLSPTRELCLQISSHLRAAAGRTAVQVVAVVGGMSLSKQTRLLSRRPQIVVSTPGRYLQLVEEEDAHCGQLSRLRFLVIDEVDRMLTDGHFANIGLIFSRIPALSEEGAARQHLQAFLFSATVPACFLSLRRHERGEPEGVRRLKRFLSQGVCEVVNLTRKEVLVESLREEKLLVESPSKILYLYCLLRLRLRGRGKVLVFANSIATLRQLFGVLSRLGLSLLVVHSGMQQKRRLKSLDEFAGRREGVLLASDVAARGIDFRDVTDIIHFHVPATAQLYVHRCGRTARTRLKDGRSLLLVSPEESRRYLSICKSLCKLKEIPPATLSLSEVGFLIW